VLEERPRDLATEAGETPNVVAAVRELGGGQEPGATERGWPERCA
jgi:hypothetical protein